MTDHELLELAAKVAGITQGKVKFLKDNEREWDAWIFDDDTASTNWNPLTDNGDALWLAVKLNFDVSNYVADEDSPACCIVAGYETNAYYKELHGDDPYAATRRAIVRCAAEIGKGME